jgi:hypothetical protein
MTDAIIDSPNPAARAAGGAMDPLKKRLNLEKFRG